MFKRARRLRNNYNFRKLTQETVLNINDFIYPLFVKENLPKKIEIESMPGVFQMNVDEILQECQELIELDLKTIILFGIPLKKDEIGSHALRDDNIITTTIKAIKSKYQDISIIVDLCFCEYTSHGHCGVLDDNNIVDNDKTLSNLQKQALIYAKAGADMIAPSGMMDGVVWHIRDILDKNGFYNLPIISYSTKFASSYYGPFRDVAESTPQCGDRKTYQMSPANLNEAILESLEDEKQGADILMIKPALAYLDVVREIRNNTKLPIAVYNVSGEYSMLKLAQKYNIVNYDDILLETMTSFKRAGADIIISYHAKEVAQLLKQKPIFY
jgi:porphobilinogen synthase